jgi:hypothetical protein
VFRTLLPGSFFSEELTRPFDYSPKAFDCGCIQSDGVTVDIKKTIAAYTSIANENSRNLDHEVQWCKDNEIAGIISDITPFAFEVARHAAIPSIAVTNFTWYDIYNEYCAAFPMFVPYVETIKRQYGYADLLLELTPSTSLDYFKNRKPMPIVGRKGNDIRKEFTHAMKISPEKRLGLIYTGAFGMESAKWKKLERFSEWEFVGLYPLPGAPKNFRCISKREFRHQDVIASVDVVIAKIGYGVYSECLLNGAPLIYLRREHFAEYPVLESAVVEWGNGCRLSHEDYFALRWDDALAAAVAKRRPQPLRSDGALLCALEIEKTMGAR